MPLAFSLVLAACGGSDGEDSEPFDTLQDCYDDHHTVGSFSVHDSIVICCLDHPIAGVHPACANTQADCVSYVDAELDPSVGLGDIQVACTDYIAEL